AFLYHNSTSVSMIVRPSTSTLFPYTNALPISGADLKQFAELRDQLGAQMRAQMEATQKQVREAWFAVYDTHLLLRRFHLSAHLRSEEHTSELQSRGHLVCRLLLEKKKTNDAY